MALVKQKAEEVELIIKICQEILLPYVRADLFRFGEAQPGQWPDLVAMAREVRALLDAQPRLISYGPVPAAKATGLFIEEVFDDYRPQGKVFRVYVWAGPDLPAGAAEEKTQTLASPLTAMQWARTVLLARQVRTRAATPVASVYIRGSEATLFVEEHTAHVPAGYFEVYAED